MTLAALGLRSRASGVERSTIRRGPREMAANGSADAFTCARDPYPMSHHEALGERGLDGTFLAECGARRGLQCTLHPPHPVPPTHSGTPARGCCGPVDSTLRRTMMSPLGKLAPMFACEESSAASPSGYGGRQQRSHDEDVGKRETIGGLAGPRPVPTGGLFCRWWRKHHA